MIVQLMAWIGNKQIVTSDISLETVHLMQATLNRDPALDQGNELPPAWPWLFFHKPVRARDLSPDGHARLGGFLPPIHFGEQSPRRMWAGGTIEFVRPLRIGDHATKVSTVQSITPKQGRSGRLFFVVVTHEVLVENERCLMEEQTLVYREPVKTAVGAGEAPCAPTDGEFAAVYHPDPMLLFRYSALTFNTHRIHYDVDYCREVEAYPGLVVHGPLTATLLLDLFSHHNPHKPIRRFDYRMRSPLFSPHPFSVHGKADGQAWVRNHLGGMAVSAHISHGNS